MKLNQLIAQALNKPVEALTIEDIIWGLQQNVVTYTAYRGDGAVTGHIPVIQK